MIIDKNTIVPSEKMILVEVQEKQMETSSGLILAGDEKNTAPVIGMVIAVGKNSIYKKGDTICYRRYSIDQLTFQNGDKEETIYFLADTDILATIEEVNKREAKDPYQAVNEKIANNIEVSLRNKKDEKETENND